MYCCTYVVLLLLAVHIHLTEAQATPVTVNAWPGGMMGNLSIRSDHHIFGWRIQLMFDSQIDQLDVWAARIVNQTGYTYFLQNQIWNADIKPGVDFVITFSARFTGSQPHVTYTVEVSSLRYNYSRAMELSMLFYYAQRSGRLPADNPISWRGDSAMQDGDKGHDLSGGWYDAGGFVKYNLPMAFSTWVLSWGLLTFRSGYQVAGLVDMACDTIRWPLEYFLKCWIPEEQKLYVQVGDGDIDQQYWGRAEDMAMSRPAYAIPQHCKGSDVSGDMVSALASGYLVFKDVCPDSDFANKLLEAARSLYTFTMNHRGIYTQCLVQTAKYYRSYGETDEVSAAGAWMYRATRENHYLSDAIKNYRKGITWAFSWDVKDPAAAILLYHETHDYVYSQDIQRFIHEYMPGGGVHYTSCGLAWKNEWGVNRYAANAAVIAVMAANEGILPTMYKTWALSQINYLLGDNNYNVSYQIGFGEIFPLHPHHSGSACPTNVDWCMQNAPGPNPNVLLGALVGGPDQFDHYDDRRDDYVKNSVACSYNAGFQSTLAGLYYFATYNDLPASPSRHC